MNTPICSIRRSAWDSTNDRLLRPPWRPMSPRASSENTAWSWPHAFFDKQRAQYATKRYKRFVPYLIISLHLSQVPCLTLTLFSWTKKTMRFFTAVLAALTLVAPVFAAPTSLRTVEKYDGKTSGKFIVKLKDGVSKSAILRLLKGGSAVTDDWKLFNGFAGAWWLYCLFHAFHAPPL